MLISRGMYVQEKLRFLALGRSEGRLIVTCVVGRPAFLLLFYDVILECGGFSSNVFSEESGFFVFVFRLLEDVYLRDHLYTRQSLRR